MPACASAPARPDSLDDSSGLRRNGAVAVFALLVLALINALWFNSFNYHTIMGDDLYGWAFYTQHPSFHDLFLTASGGKYRPVVSAVQYVLFHQFSADYQAWVGFNVALNFLIVCVLFVLLRRVTRNDNVIAFLGALLYVTCRFSYYNILQINGVLEALSILFLLVIMYLAVEYMARDSRWIGYGLAVLYLVITLTHERFIVLFPFLVLLVVFKTGVRRRRKGLLLGLFCLPPMLNVVLKLFVFDTSFLMGTGGQALGFDPIGILKFMTKGFVNMFWINWGPDYLSGITFSEMGTRARVLTVLIAVFLVAVLALAALRVLRIEDSGQRRAEIKGFVLWLVLFLSVLLAASITIRQEYRWLYAPFVVCLVYFCYQFARLPGRAVLKYVSLAVLCLMAVTADSYFKHHEGSVFFCYGESVADSTYNATMGRYGRTMRQRTMYVERSPEMEWVLGGTLFLSPYLGIDHQKIVWVDSFDDVDQDTIDPGKCLFFRRDPTTGSFDDVTREVLGY